MNDAARHRATLAVLLDVSVERERQIEDHGWTPEHDDRHDTRAWSWLLMKRVTDLACPIEEARTDDPRRALLEVAAIAVAAIESLDRCRHASLDDRDGGQSRGGFPTTQAGEMSTPCRWCGHRARQHVQFGSDAAPAACRINNCSCGQFEARPVD